MQRDGGAGTQQVGDAAAERGGDADARVHRAPELLIVGIPVGELQVLDTWHTSGLRGTGSHDAVAEACSSPSAGR